MYKGESDQTVNEVLDGTPVILRFKWNTRFSFWSMSIYDRQGEPLLMGIKLVRDFPLLDRLNLTNIPGDFTLVRLFGDWDYPRFDSLPEEGAIVWWSPEEIEAVKNGIV